MKIATSLLFLLLLTGCCSTPTDNAIWQFQRKHPMESKEYVTIYPTSLELYISITGEQAGYMTRVLENLKKKYGGVDGLNEYIERALDGQIISNRATVKQLDEFNAISTNGATVCEFDRNDGKTHEFGVMALRNGDIIKKNIWFSEQVRKP